MIDLVKNYLSVSATYKGSQASINESAIQIINILKSLSVMDELFLQPIFITGQKGRIAVDLSNSNLIEQTKLISEALLRSSKYDIKLYENVNNPDENYRRKDGFRIMMEFKVDHRTSFYCTCRMGAEECQTFTFLGYKDEVLKEYLWYFNFLKILIEKLVCVEGEIFIKVGNFGGYYVDLKAKHHLHWISYYSNDFHLKIPDNIGGVEYLHTEDGKYLITSKDDFLKDKESFDKHKEKIKGIVEEIKVRIPGFAKE